jgi:hypothetical protein
VKEVQCQRFGELGTPAKTNDVLVNPESGIGALERTLELLVLDVDSEEV